MNFNTGICGEHDVAMAELQRRKCMVLVLRNHIQIKL